MITEKGKGVRVVLDGVELFPDIAILNAQDENPHMLSIRFSLKMEGVLEPAEVKQVIRKRFINNEVYDDPGRDTEISSKDAVRGMRDLFIDICNEMDGSELEDMVVKQRAQNAG